MWTKVCGITSVEDAQVVADCHPSAIGLNFYRKSKRGIDAATACKIRKEIPSEIEAVGLFVNHTKDEIDEICMACELNTIQLHGDETPEFAASLCDRYQVIRALRVDDSGLEPIADEIEQLQSLLGDQLLGILIDAKVDGAYGGTGHTAPWDLLAEQWRSEWPKLILAGGLTADNVAQAIERVHPWGVDVASGVELEPGRKSRDAVEAFLRNAQSFE